MYDVSFSESNCVFVIFQEPLGANDTYHSTDLFLNNMGIHGLYDIGLVYSNILVGLVDILQGDSIKTGPLPLS